MSKSASYKPRIRNCAEIHLKVPLVTTVGQSTCFLAAVHGKPTGHKLTVDLDGGYVTIKPHAKGNGTFCVPLDGVKFWKPAMGHPKEDAGTVAEE
jgi:hypothetical protein